MPVLTPTPIAAMSAWPSTSQTEEDFNAAADAVGVAMPPTVLAMNALAANVLNNAQYVELQATAGLASSNFKGQWSGLTGALNVPASVFHNEMYWQLLANLANVATDQPGVTANWRALPNAAGSTNYVDNGGCTVEQVTGTVLTATDAHSNVDRFLVSVLGGTSVSGTNGSAGSSGFVTKRGVGIAPGTFTSGQARILQRLESARAKVLSGKTITISCRLYHDFGSSRNVTLQLLKCNAIDNWTAKTSVSTSSSVSCGTGTYTTVRLTVTLGATDADNGIEVVLQDTAVATVTSKFFVASEWKMEVGSVATPFQPDNLDDTLRRCQRYYEILGGDQGGSIQMGGWAPTNPTPFYATIPFTVQKWKSNATVTVSGTWFTASCTQPVLLNLAGTKELTLYCQSTTSGAGVNASNSGGASRVLVDARL